MRDPYDLFARTYDAWQSGYPKPFAEAVLPFYEREIERYGVPETSMAELACGTGTFLCAWARRHRGWILMGSDQSAGMLRAARWKLRAAGLTAKLLRQRLQKVALPRPAGLAVCVFDSINHLTRSSDLHRSLRAIARSLLPGALLVFDTNDERAFGRIFTGTWTVDTEGLHVAVAASASDDETFGTLGFRIFERRKGNCWRRTDITIRERNWRSCEVVEALDAAGLDLLRVRRIQPYPPDQVEAPRSLWVCRRKES